MPPSLTVLTASTWYRKGCFQGLDATSSEDEFEQMLENLPEPPTLIVDFPGNKTSKILEFADHFQMLIGHPAHTPDIHRGRFDR
jgi:hypothetical protein